MVHSAWLSNGTIESSKVIELLESSKVIEFFNIIDILLFKSKEDYMFPVPNLQCGGIQVFAKFNFNVIMPNFNYI